jgi:cytochrome c oxidase subunit II
MTRVLTFCLAFSVATIAAAADPDEFTYCTVCHGIEGNGNPAIHAPKIAGLAPWYVDAQLNAFRAGWRGADPADTPGHEMRPVAAELPNDAAVARAVAYVAAFVPIAPPITIEGNPIAGAALYAPCAACHGAAGEGNESLGAPALAGQNDWYLVTQIHNYRDGRRGTHPDDVRGATMRPLVATLPDDAAIVDVVAYINSLH